ncbi:MFS transporter [Sphingobacterium spiritivorum]|uniref:Transporter, major facilitator family protein n=1 Tax=Sphingobacterium spiritivorum ATCC 33861 TaxID=525373 RepID=D7VQN5_SPHSI|nr:MFS transporter [Sphingobacterium spiritivorum]EFK56086.1 transporter, major facilitator family protein [Sphingobacterium spiritivorum ATCC 33861]QQT35792.1 MFS transporter [Sphingobacterium spiritivorum]WQD32514.1 MFS transporter [Sphingobacterium spiritivorum]SUJ10382.1 Spectinomycin tetracycline efflux pump [Sphingobacterium spiritivorum]
MNRYVQLLLVSTGIFLFVIDLFIINVSLPSIQAGLHAQDSQAQWIVILYVIGYASLLVTGSKAGTYWGKKKVYNLSMLFFILSSALCGIAANAEILLAGRLIQGVSSAFMVPQGIAFIPDIFDTEKDRVKALGIYGSIAGAASVLGQLLGGILPDVQWITDGWRLIFLINIPIGLVSLLLAMRYLPDHHQPAAGRFNSSGVILLALSIMTLIYPIIQAAEHPWSVWYTVLLLCSFIFGLRFVYLQKKDHRKGLETLIDFSLFRNTYFRLGLWSALFYYMVQDSYFILTSLYLQRGLDVSSTQTGFYFVAQGIGYVLASLVSIRYNVLHGKRVLLSGIFIMVIGLCIHLLIFSMSNVSHTVILLTLFWYGLGCGTVLPSMMTMALKTIQEKKVGIASGMYLTLQQLAVGIGVGLLTTVFFHFSKTSLSSNSMLTAYYYSIGVCIILLLTVAFLFLKLPEAEAETNDK